MTCVPPTGIKITDIRAVAVAPYVQPRIIEEDETLDHSGPDSFSHGFSVDERTGTLIRENDLHQGTETLADFNKTRMPRRFLHCQPVQ
ncbi:conserved hypothetical protein [Paraburkholderia piptadeniae]|uniref:Uncharacterized protein n=1 Tax=Paraburkholderia piptadeniae TaxID=1701573 RepID=A0A1N7RPI2_9BURK|nr:conserved hypothetical protein [Paraburkholderia piptadeniae]